jgi:hypothetical protein
MAQVHLCNPAPLGAGNGGFADELADRNRAIIPDLVLVCEPPVSPKQTNIAQAALLTGKADSVRAGE